MEIAALGVLHPQSDTEYPLDGLESVTLPSGVFLYAYVSSSGELICYALGEGAEPVWLGAEIFSPSVYAGIGTDFAYDSARQALVWGGPESLSQVSLSDAGEIGTFSQTQTPSAYAALSDTEHIVSAAGLGRVDFDAQSYVLVLDQGASCVASFASTAQGDLSFVARCGASDGVGMSGPTAMKVCSAYGQSWVIVAAANSNSLSVMRLEEDGALTPTEHIIDTRHTRFEGVQAMELVEWGEQRFILAGGADDGISLFALLPNGALTHLSSLENTGVGLESISRITAQQVGESLQIFASSEAHGALVRLAAPLGPQSEVIRSDTPELVGTLADDILYAEAQTTQITGGGGRDIFILPDQVTLSITDFDPASDRLDISHWVMLRHISQIEISNSETHTTLVYGENRVTLLETGLRSAADFETLLAGPDHVLPLLTEEAGENPQPEPAVVLPDIPGSLTPNAAPAINLAQVGFSFSGGPAGDVHWGSGADDLLLGGGGADVLGGGIGNDQIHCGDESDQAWGAAGQDTLRGDEGDDTLGGGTGHDAIWGGLGADVLYGGAGSDWLQAGAGDDQIWAAADHDKLMGDTGDDELGGGTGHDQITAGAGNDTLYGSWGRDTLHGQDGQDTLWGDAGTDMISGGAGDDQIGGGLDNDTLWGNDGNDLIWGGGGDDMIFGGPGADRLIGAAGADSFVFTTGDGQDRLRDFDSSQDQLLFHNTGLDRSELTLSSSSQGIWVHYDSDAIFLEGISTAEFGAADILFI